MHCLRVLIVFILMACVRSANVGSTIFYKKRFRTECFTLDDLAKLKARQMFEDAMPDVPPTDKVDKNYVTETIRFFRQALHEVDKDLDQHTGDILKEALIDTFGGFMRTRLLPTLRFAYYAGFIPCRTTKYAQDFFEELKTELNTQGMGWAEPEVPNHANLSVVKVFIGSGKFFDSCASLISKRDTNSCIHLPPPKLDDSEMPSAIALPFKKGGFISLSSPTAENILLKYYTTASRCILGSSPRQCRHADFVTFNNEMWHWMKRDVAPHLVDEKLYCAYGGVLRIAAAVQSYGKGLARRNLFEQDFSSKWKPWRRLSSSYIKLDMDWTPGLYIFAVFVAAILICCFQTMYFFLFSKRGCMCKGGVKQLWETNDLTYAQVDSNIPAMINEQQNAIYYTDRNRLTKDSPKTRSTSLGSIKTQKVYDLNDNTEKMMPVILSGNEDSDVESQSTIASNRSKQESDGSRVSVATKRSVQSTARSKSPPKLQTPIAQLKLDSPKRAEKKRPRRSMYSTRTPTRSNVTTRYCSNQQGSESSWSDSSISDRSVSSASFKSQSCQSSSTRDLAWARRVVSKHSGQTQTQSKSTTGTDFDLNSFTTPPSRR